MKKSTIQEHIRKVESAIAYLEKSISDAREKAAEIEEQFNTDCKSLSEAYSTYTESKTSDNYNAYDVIYQRLVEAKSRHDEIRIGFDRKKANLKILRIALKKYQRMLATAEDDPAQPSSNV